MANTTGKKFGGREHGTPNKVTKELRERINDFLNDNWKLFIVDFQQLEPEKRLQLYEKLLQYTLPRLQSINLDANIDKKVIEFKNVSKQFPDQQVD